MFKSPLSFSLITGALLLAGQGTAAANEADEAAITELLNTAYLKGFYHDLDAEIIRTGFHPDMVLSVNAGGEVSYVPLPGWMAYEGVGVPESELTEEQKAKTSAELNILSIDVVDSTAAAKAEILINGELTYTNFYGLYKIDGNWVVVNKLFNMHAHQE